LIGALAIVGAPATADTLSGAVLINWNPNYLYGGPSYVPGLYYWNNDSGDGTDANVGWCLVGSGQCAMKNAPGRISFYATPSLTAPTDMYFTSAGHAMQLTLDLSLTAEKGGGGMDFFGYYLTDSTGAQIGNPTIVFNSNQASGATALLPSLSPGQNYGFFIENIQGYGTSSQQTDYSFYMNSSANSSTGFMPAGNLQHFAIFQYGATYYLGTVDAAACSGSFTVDNSPCISSSQFDYNDMVVQLSSVVGQAEVGHADPVPEPAGLLPLGIIVVALAVRRRFAAALR
jgi:hypothetical protein